MQKIVKLIDDGATTCVFKGDSVDALVVYETLKKYHEYDDCITIEIVDEDKPLFNSLNEFLSVHEYKYTLEEMQKENRWFL